ncbi:MAG: hypothetical protein U0L09_02365 [Christensenellales bacterium]|nr:hypothetical protein [Christensenellales bacterium]
MSNRGNNAPSMDYFEMRRRHEEFKRRQREKSMSESGPEQQQPSRTPQKTAQPAAPACGVKVTRDEVAAQSVPSGVERVEPDISEAPPIVDEAVSNICDRNPAADVPSDGAAPEAAESDSYEDSSDSDEFFDENIEEGEDSLNPFSTFIHAFHRFQSRLKNRRSGDGDGEVFDEEDFDGELLSEDGEILPKKRRFPFSFKKIKQDYVDYDDSDFADEEGDPALSLPIDSSIESDDVLFVDSVEAHPSVLFDSDATDADNPESASEICDLDSVDSEDGIEAFDGPDIREDFEDFENNSENEPADEYEDDFFDDEAASEPSALKRFISLFIVKEEDELPLKRNRKKTVAEDYYVDESRISDDNPINVDYSEVTFDDASDLYYDYETAEVEGIKGGSDMDENNRLDREAIAQLEAGLETSGMTRRQRRELAERMAAEKSAVGTDQNSQCTAQPDCPAAVPAESVVTDTAVDMPSPAEIKLSSNNPFPIADLHPSHRMPETDLLFADKVEDLSDGIVEIDDVSVNKSTAIPDMPALDTFVDEPTRAFKPLSKTTVMTADNSSDMDEFNFDEDEMPEEENPKRGLFSLFSRKKEAVASENEDEENAVFEDEEELENDNAPSSRRGLFGIKSRVESRRAKAVEDEDDDGDDYDDDDYDDDDYDEDDYDDDDYDEDDYDDDDYDDYDDGESFARPIIGFFKVLFGFILVLLIFIFTLNFLDYFNVFSLDSLFERHYNKVPGLLDTLFPSHNLKRLVAPTETITAIDPLNDGSVQDTDISTPELTADPSAFAAPIASAVATATADMNAVSDSSVGFGSDDLEAGSFNENIESTQTFGDADQAQTQVVG